MFLTRPVEFDGAPRARQGKAQDTEFGSAGPIGRMLHACGSHARAMAVALMLLPALIAGTSHSVAAQEADPDAVAMPSARDVLEQTTEDVLAVIDEARDYAENDPERYYTAVHAVLDPVVDFGGFARSVMGEYATSQRYRSLDEAGQTKLRDQLERFTETMRVGLVRTYSKGLLAFGGSRVEIDDGASKEEGRRASLRQLIYSEQTQPYVVLYTMGRNREGQWLIRNLVVENVNLGQIYRSQFEAAARRHDGDIDKVIETWDTQTGVEG